MRLLIALQKTAANAEVCPVHLCCWLAFHAVPGQIGWVMSGELQVPLSGVF